MDGDDVGMPRSGVSTWRSAGIDRPQEAAGLREPRAGLVTRQACDRPRTAARGRGPLSGRVPGGDAQERSPTARRPRAGQPADPPRAAPPRRRSPLLTPPPGPADTDGTENEVASAQPDSLTKLAHGGANATRSWGRDPSRTRPRSRWNVPEARWFAGYRAVAGVSRSPTRSPPTRLANRRATHPLPPAARRKNPFNKLNGYYFSDVIRFLEV